MMRKLIAMFIGNRIDRSDGRGGIKGAVAGLAVDHLLRGRLAPLGWLLIGVVALWRFVFGRRTRVRRG